MSFTETSRRVTARTFRAFGVWASLDVVGPPVRRVRLLVVLDDSTETVGELGGVRDPNPSVQLQRADLADVPAARLKGAALTLDDGRVFRLGKFIDQDADVMRRSVEAVPA